MAYIAPFDYRQPLRMDQRYELTLRQEAIAAFDPHQIDRETRNMLAALGVCTIGDLYAHPEIATAIKDYHIAITNACPLIGIRAILLAHRHIVLTQNGPAELVARNPDELVAVAGNISSIIFAGIYSDPETPISDFKTSYEVSAEYVNGNTAKAVCYTGLDSTEIRVSTNYLN